MLGLYLVSTENNITSEVIASSLLTFYGRCPSHRQEETTMSVNPMNMNELRQGTLTEQLGIWFGMVLES